TRRPDLSTASGGASGTFSATTMLGTPDSSTWKQPGPRGPILSQSIVSTAGMSTKGGQALLRPSRLLARFAYSDRIGRPLFLDRGLQVEMGYRTLAGCVEDLKRTGQLVAIDQDVDPRLEAAAIQRRVYEAGGPALLFPRVKGTSFPMVGNLFGSMERTHYIFRDTLEAVRHLVELKVKPPAALARPWRYRDVPFTALHLLPMKVRGGPILAHQTTLGRLPQLQSWPDDGGAFVTLPQVYTEDPDRPGLARSNLGMYRVQLSGNAYEPNREVGLHYQIHRGIGVHHAAALRRGETLRVNVFVGGPPALTVAAVMPLPEALPELAFAGALGGRRVAMVAPDGGLPMPAEADFVIVGSIDPTSRKPEG